jgi:hypothetical protein
VTLDSPELKDDLKVAAKAAFDEVRAAHPTDHFYAFGLYTDDSVAGISPAANTEEALAATIAKYNHTDRADVAFDRWSGVEWSHAGFGWEHFQDVYNAIMNMDRDDDFGAFRESVFELMVSVLSELDDEGTFGSGRQREQVTLLCFVTDSADSEDLERRSIRALNPSSVVRRYLQDRGA